AGPGIKKGNGQVFYNLKQQFPVVAVVGLGKENSSYNENEEIDEGSENVRIAAAVGCKKLQEVGVTKVLLEGMGNPEAAAEGATLGLWLYQAFKNEKKQKKTPELNLFEENENDKCKWEKGVLKAKAQNVARNLTDTPANRMTPKMFAEAAINLLTPLGVSVTAHDKTWAEEKKMGSFLSVSHGSAQPPIFLEIQYIGSSNSNKPVVLVGKGVTFDSGGISLKPSGSMDEMRGDMGGAACVVATIYAAKLLKLNINIIGLIPLTENMPSGTATKPGDVVFAMNGKSILVDNTDAEGRNLFLRAIRIALGGAATGVFTNSSPIFQQLKEASIVSGDRVWRMPLWQYYGKQMTECPSSDLVNISRGSSPGGGSCTAAAFLKEFAPDGDWMHLDIAGVMGTSEGLPYLSKGMTGRPTRTLIEFISSLAEKYSK
ncbi:Cytosol aminopeptidase, partial [Blattella germanica]